MAPRILHVPLLMMGQIVYLSGLPNTHLLLSNGRDLQNVYLRVLPGVKTGRTCILSL